MNKLLYLLLITLILPIYLQGQYSNGDLLQITRLDGEGAGGYFLDLTQASADAIVNNNVQSEITYKIGAAPFEVKVIDESALQLGTYTISIIDGDLGDNILNSTFFWLLEGNGYSFQGQQPVGMTAYEEQIPDLGISIKFQQTQDVFEDIYDTNGFINASIEYADPAGVEWYGAMADEEIGTFFITNFIKNGLSEPDEIHDPVNIYGNDGILDETWYPFAMTTSSPDPGIPGIGNGDYYITPHPASSNVALANFIKTRLWGPSNEAQPLTKKINNVDIVLTSDKSKWSRCAVVNTFSNYYQMELGFNPDATAGHFGVRSDASVDQNGLPDGTGTGMSWFPGYAIDVETGRRLNVFFGENTFFDQNVSANIPDNTGADMIWNPSPIEQIVSPTTALTEMSYGAQHHIYVSTTTYDECDAIRASLDGSIIQILDIWTNLSWVSTPVPTVPLNSITDGLIPNDVTFKLRVNNHFQVTDYSNNNNGYGAYQFTISENVNTQEVEYLPEVQVLPNPAFVSSIEQVSITNLPERSIISIYTIDGRLVRQLKNQTDVLTWDMKSNNGQVVPFGTYMIHIDANESEKGVRTIKWIGGR